MNIPLRPASELFGSITVPGDKSISHRALILNALAQGSAIIDGFTPNADCLSTIGCLQALGVEIEQNGNHVRLRSPGWSGLRSPINPLDCGNSGTSMRLLAGVAAGISGVTVLDGDRSLRTRPMNRVLEPLASMGALVSGRAQGTLAPISIRGASLQPFNGQINVPSAQVKSAILIAALAAGGVSRLEERVATRDHTEIMLAEMGVVIDRESMGDGHTIFIEPNLGLHPVDLTVSGDLSAAAYWLVAGSLAKNAEIQLPNVGINPTRSGVIEILENMGAKIVQRNFRIVKGESVSDLVVQSARLHGTKITGSLIPRSIDELPVIAVAASMANGITEIRDAEELRVKESDRIAAVAAMLRSFGASVDILQDGLRIFGNEKLQGAKIDSHGDHRVAMSAAIAALFANGESLLDDKDVVQVSYPLFWEDMASITGR